MGWVDWFLQVGSAAFILVAIGEYGIRLAPAFPGGAQLITLYAVALLVIGEAQWFFSRWAFLKMNSGFGLSQKVPDIAPEVGIMMSFRP